MNEEFSKFESNVVQWAVARGIFAHSNFGAQMLKAVSETGELADAIIKDDTNGMIDAVGDVAVCLVNAYTFISSSGGALITRILEEPVELSQYDSVLSGVGHLTHLLGKSLNDVECLHILGNRPTAYKETQELTLRYAMSTLIRISKIAGLDFLTCCEAAWNEIKDRTGHMVEGGAFVKDEV